MQRLTLLVVLGLALACGGGPDDDDPSASPARVAADGTITLGADEIAAAGIVVAPATEGDVADSVTRYGRVDARPGDDAIVAAPVAGRVPSAPLVVAGAEVRAGDPIVALVPTLGPAGVQGAAMKGEIASETRRR